MKFLIIILVISFVLAISSSSECPTDIEPCQCKERLSNLEFICVHFENISQVKNALKKFPSQIDTLGIKHNSANIPSDIFQDVCIDSLILWLSRLNISDSIFSSQAECLEVLVIRGGVMKEIPVNVLLPLKHLTSLAFAQNHISELKEPLWKLKLQYLTVDSNNMTRIHAGVFPSTLIFLSLINNHLKTLNNSLLFLNDLQMLLLSNNSIKTLNHELTGLKKLTWLYAEENQIETLDDSLHKLSNLEHLALPKNRISSLGGSLHGLYNLEILNLSYNLLSELSDTEFQSLINLITLDLSHNQINSLGKSLTSLKKMQSLNLAGNQLSDIGGSFGCLNELRNLDISGNRLENLDFFNIKEKPENCHFEENNRLETIDITGNPLRCTKNVISIISNLILNNVTIIGNPC